MGLEMRYQAVPSTWRWLQRKPLVYETESAFAFLVPQVAQQSAPRALQSSRHDSPDHTEVDFARELLHLIRVHPGLEQRNLYIGERWDMLYYLLSPTRRASSNQNYTDWVARVLLGGDELQGLVSSEGIAVYYLPPDEVQTSAFLLGQVTQERLSEHFDPQRMIAAGVYGSLSLIGRHVSFASLWQSFQQLHFLFKDVAAHREGIVAYAC
ncbi:MAG: DUF1877 family protein [Anaerolineae bacterium]|nr:DUF1877 family protein [Anaerolineae bacterium]MBN8619791.1 DUF1877 family protein [Anaerolineae bacterium]